MGLRFDGKGRGEGDGKELTWQSRPIAKVGPKWARKEGKATPARAKPEGRGSEAGEGRGP